MMGGGGGRVRDGARRKRVGLRGVRERRDSVWAVGQGVRTKRGG